MFLLCLWDSLVTLELISLIPLVDPPFTDPLAVKLLNNQLYISDKPIWLIIVVIRLFFLISKFTIQYYLLMYHSYDFKRTWNPTGHLALRLETVGKESFSKSKLSRKTVIFCGLSLLFYVCNVKNVSTSKKIILANKQCVKHPFAGRNTQQTEFRTWRILPQIPTFTILIFEQIFYDGRD